jgi:hypothetical protein
MAGRCVLAGAAGMVVAAVLGPTAPALAGPLFTAGITGVVQVSNSPVPLLLTTNQDPNGGHLEGTAISDSQIGAKLVTSDPARGFGTGLFTSGSANVIATFDDIVITGPGTDPVPVTLHLPFQIVFFQDWSFLDFDGGSSDVSRVNQSVNLSAALFTLFGGSPNAQIVVSSLDDESETADVGIGGQNGGTAQASGSAANPLDTGGFLDLVSRTEIPIMTGPGVMPPGAGFEVDDAVGFVGELLLPGMAPLDTPLKLQLSMSVGSSAFGGFSLAASGSVDALSPRFGIPQGGAPVFDLPEGYTANSLSLGIVDNVAPEPSRSLLADTALAALLVTRIRRRTGKAG